MIFRLEQHPCKDKHKVKPQSVPTQASITYTPLNRNKHKTFQKSK